MFLDDFAKNGKEKLKLAAGFALVFVLGFSCGFYYLEGESDADAIEIIEGSKDCSSFFTSGETENSSAYADGTNQDTDAGESQISGAIAADAVSANTVGANSTGKKLYVASKNSNLYHTLDCPYVKQIKEENLIWFISREEAEASGRKPHSCVDEEDADDGSG